MSCGALTADAAHAGVGAREGLSAVAREGALSLGGGRGRAARERALLRRVARPRGAPAAALPAALARSARSGPPPLCPLRGRDPRAQDAHRAPSVHTSNVTELTCVLRERLSSTVFFLTGFQIGSSSSIFRSKLAVSSDLINLLLIPTFILFILESTRSDPYLIAPHTRVQVQYSTRMSHLSSFQRGHLLVFVLSGSASAISSTRRRMCRSTSAALSTSATCSRTRRCAGRSPPASRT